MGQIVSTLGVLIFASSLSAFIISPSHCLSKCGNNNTGYNVAPSLSMNPRETTESEIPLRLKQNKIKRSYNKVPGYVKRRIDLLQAVFTRHSNNGEMTYDAFLNSKYLRYWPGRKQDIEKIWSDLTDDVSSLITEQQISLLLSKLDDVAIQTELEMERERLTWELEDIKYNFLENYFETAANGRKLSYSTFIKWESVQAQLWYNTNGLSERVIAEIWQRIAGCVSQSVDLETFVKIYNTVCRGGCD